MPPPNPIDQDRVYYSRAWSRDIERFVFEKLEHERWKGRWIPGQHVANRTVIENVCPAVARQHNIALPLEDYFRKYDEWVRRYENFKWLLKYPEVYYNELENHVYTWEDNWELIVQDRSEAAAYMTEGEANWWYLKRLFQTEEDDPESTITGTRVGATSRSQPAEVRSHMTIGHRSNNPFNFHLIDETSDDNSWDNI